MTEVVKVDFKRPELTTPLTALDALSTETQTVVDVQRHISKFLEVEPYTLEDADRCIAALRTWKTADQELTDLAIRIERGLSVATPVQIQEQLALLLGAFPSSFAPDPEVYSQMMLNEVVAAEPSVIALTMACSELRRTLKRPPSIAQVLTAIRDQEACWRYRFRCVSANVSDYEKALAKLLKRRAWLTRPEAERDADRKKDLARLNNLRKLLRSGLRHGTEKKRREA